MTSFPRTALCGAFCAAAFGCSSLDRFDTNGDDAYCGEIVGGPDFHDGFIPDLAPPRLEIGLEIDAGALTSRPGVLTSNDRETGLCTAEGHALFESAPLRAIPELLNDPLSTLEFGEGRDHNLFAWVDSSCQGTLLGVLSLLRNDNVELRLFKPATLPAPEAAAGERPGFALFYLRRRDHGCEF